MKEQVQTVAHSGREATARPPPAAARPLARPPPSPRSGWWGVGGRRRNRKSIKNFGAMRLSMGARGGGWGAPIERHIAPKFLIDLRSKFFEGEEVEQIENLKLIL